MARYMGPIFPEQLQLLAQFVDVVFLFTELVGCFQWTFAALEVGDLVRNERSRAVKERKGPQEYMPNIVTGPRSS